MLWLGVDKDEHGADYKGMEHLKLKPVILSVITLSDIRIVHKGVEIKELLKKVTARLFGENY